MLKNLTEPKSPEEILQAAGVAARQLVPAQQAKIAKTRAQLQKEMQQLESLEQVAKFAEIDHARSQYDAALQTISEVALFEMKRQGTEPGLDIDAALKLDGPLKVTDLRQHIAKTFGRMWGESTIYNYLNRGKAEGKYRHENNQWSLIEQDEQKEASGETASSEG